MIVFLEGELVSKTPTYFIINVSGVGYQVHISLYTYEKLVHAERARVHTAHIVREDDETLFGFYDLDERDMFLQLISITGIGPNTARQMLSSLPPSDLRHAIIQGDVTFLKSIKGIGPKSAQRIVVELQDKLGKQSPEALVPLQVKSKVSEEAIMALTTLGFNRLMSERSIQRIMSQAGADSLPVEELIKQALKAI